MSNEKNREITCGYHILWRECHHVLYTGWSAHGAFTTVSAHRSRPHPPISDTDQAGSGGARAKLGRHELRTRSRSTADLGLDVAGKLDARGWGDGRGWWSPTNWNPLSAVSNGFGERWRTWRRPIACTRRLAHIELYVTTSRLQIQRFQTHFLFTGLRFRSLLRSEPQPEDCSIRWKRLRVFPMHNFDRCVDKKRVLQDAKPPPLQSVSVPCQRFRSPHWNAQNLETFFYVHMPDE